MRVELITLLDRAARELATCDTVNLARVLKEQSITGMNIIFNDGYAPRFVIEAAGALRWVLASE